MTALVRYGGGFLRVSGVLARGLDCCCDVDPPPCPNCCITINWGAFDGNGDLFVTSTDITITLVMPTKDSRVVCDNEEVTVRIEFTLSDPVDEEDFKPFVRWDRSWEYVSHTPAVDSTCGAVFEEGLIEWCNLTADGGEPLGYFATYEVVLKYDHCWSDSGAQYGDIDAGARDPGYSTLITGTFCDSMECCEVTIDCAPCCFYLDATSGPDGYELDGAGNPVFWAENTVGDRIKLTVKGMDPETLVYCIGEVATSPIELDIQLIPVEYDEATPWYPEVGVTGVGWKRLTHTPPVGLGTVTDGPDMAINWGTDVDDLTYNVTTEVPCPNLPGIMTIGFSNGSDGSASGASILVDWICCPEDTADCEDCYPIVYTDYFSIHVSEAGYVDLTGEVPPLTDCGELYYAGRVRDTVTDPIGGAYWTHLWLVKGCFWGDDHGAQVVAYTAILQAWVDGLIAPTNGTVATPPTFGTVVDYYVSDMVDNILTTPESPNEQVDEELNITPTPCNECQDQC